MAMIGPRGGSPMKARAILLVTALCALGPLGSLTGQTPVSAQTRSCGADGTVKFICGVLSPEDLVAVPGADWVLASGYTGGPIALVSTRDYRTIPVYPTA